jgi:hypothetical protein
MLCLRSHNTEETEERSAALALYHFTILLHLISTLEERIVNREGKLESPPRMTRDDHNHLALGALSAIVSSTTCTLSLSIEGQLISTINTTQGVSKEQAL